MRCSSIAVVATIFMGLATTSGMAETKDRTAKKAPANEVRNVAGEVDEDAQIEGILIINGTVNIDGMKIPKGQKKYRSPKSGKNYLIEWGRDDNVSVTEQ